MSGFFVTRDEETSMLRCDSEDVEKVSGRLGEIDPLRVIASRKVASSCSDRGGLFEDCALRTPVEKICRTDLNPFTTGIEFLDRDNPIGSAVRQPAQAHGI